jgi:hypothetical protein
MARAIAIGFGWLCIFAAEVSAMAQEPTPRAAQATPGSGGSAAEETAAATDSASETAKRPNPADLELFDRILATLSQEDDPDGPISTDRPTFTDANTVVPRRRLQFESGFTFNNHVSGSARSTLYDLPELAMRYGLANRVEFRTYWLGQTWIQTQSRPNGPWLKSGGLSDMEVGFKWQLLVSDKERKWIPTTALITSIIAPTGGASILGAHTVEPFADLIYGWSLNDKLTLAGSTGFQNMPITHLGPRGRSGSFQRYHQSLVAFYSVNKKTTLFYEWYVWTFTNADDNRPLHFMDAGVLYLLSPDMQLDFRTGFGLSGRPGDFFTGAGYSVRF